MSEQKSVTPPGRLRERTAEEIRVILARRKKSAAELARSLSWKQPYLSRRMTGEIAFDLDDLEVIARELGVTVIELLGQSSQDRGATGQYPPHGRPAESRAERSVVRQVIAPPIPYGADAATRRPCRIQGESEVTLPTGGLMMPAA